MKAYPKIEYHNKGLFGQDCIAFDKLDGSNLRFEWGHKRGWYKFGTRTTMIDRSNQQFGKSIDIFLDKYGEDLDKIFRSKYKKVESFVVFGEFIGENSFAGQHVESDKKDVVIFDVNQYKKGFIDPYEFVSNFGHLDIPKIIYEGKYTTELINSIKNSSLSEGVIVKGKQKTKKGGDDIWMVKIKTSLWLKKVKEKFGEKYLLEELNNDKSLLNDVV
jgi:RNA ligase